MSLLCTDYLKINEKLNNKEIENFSLEIHVEKSSITARMAEGKKRCNEEAFFLDEEDRLKYFLGFSRRFSTV